MASCNQTQWWARSILRSLADLGLELVVLCPGNRDLPLLEAAIALDLPRASMVDERAAAFLALAHARATSRPAAVVTTSGSAVANCLPALVEAHAAHLPLLVLSANRPARLQACEAPQTMPQAGIFAPFTAASLALPAAAPEAWPQAAGQLRAAAEALGHGPVHLDLPLDDPLPPIPEADFHEPRLVPMPALPPRGPRPVPWDALAPLLAPGHRGVIVAGPACPLPAEAVWHLVEVTGFPLIADAPGDLRRDAHPDLVWLADALLAGPLGQARADLVLRLGPAPLARPVFTWLKAQTCPVWRFSPWPVERDFCHRSFLDIGCPTGAELERLATGLATGDPSWRQTWRRAQADAAAARRAALVDSPWNEVVAAARACAEIPAEDIVFLANSLSVRHGNLHLAPAACGHRVFANRGVNGIDGQVATAIGLGLATGRRVRALLGDLALLHDLPALASTRIAPAGGDLVVLANGGGAIFDLLPVADHPELHAAVRTPQVHHLGPAAAQFGLDHVACTSADHLDQALGERPPGWRLIEARVDGGQTATAWRPLIAAMAGR